MSIASSLYALGDAIDPRLSYWSVTLNNGKHLSERQLVPTLRAGVKGVRRIDWALDLVATGDIHRVREVTLHCPDGRTGVLEVTPDMPAFQFKAKSLVMMGDDNDSMEFQAVGRVVDKLSGACECFIWDYRPKPGEPQLVAYKSSIYHFGAWRDTICPIGALGLDVQGFRLS